MYLLQTSPCQITFFPDDNCRIQGHSEKEMFDIIDRFHDNNLNYARPCIHYFRGVYSSGGHPDWPAHRQGEKICI